jgi:hypothetical protein
MCQQVPGWGVQKIQKFGDKFVTCIVVFMRDMGLPLCSNIPAEEKKEEGGMDSLPEVIVCEDGAMSSSETSERGSKEEDISKPRCGSKNEELIVAEGEDDIDDRYDAVWTIANPFKRPSSAGRNNNLVQNECTEKETIMMGNVTVPQRMRQSESAGLISTPHCPGGTFVPYVKPEGDQEVEVQGIDDDNDYDDVEVHIDMFGPVKIAVQSSDSSGRGGSGCVGSESTLCAETGAPTTGGSAARLPTPPPRAPAALKRKRSQPMSGLGE